jgi:hypothetical protein
MGNAHAHRRRLTPGIVIALVVALATVAALAVLAGPAAALPTFTQAQFGFGPCATCHTKTSVHTQPNHSGVYPTCANCHAGGDTSQPPLPSACGVCHSGPAAILATANHSTQGCGTTNGCHDYSAAPTITSFSPTSGAAGTVVTVTGTQFTSSTTTTVLVGGTTANAVSVDTPKSLKVTVPAGAVTGPISVTTSGGTIVSAGTFTVTTVPSKPTIAKLSPTSGKRGVIVTITGKNLGALRGASYVKFGTVKATKYPSWTATKIKVAVPKTAKVGATKITITTKAGKSNAKSFTVKR